MGSEPGPREDVVRLHSSQKSGLLLTSYSTSHHCAPLSVRLQTGIQEKTTFLQMGKGLSGEVGFLGLRCFQHQENVRKHLLNVHPCSLQGLSSRMDQVCM